MKRLLAIAESIDALTARMSRLLCIQKRTIIELEDDPVHHLQPCSECKTNLTRFGICGTCEAKSNGHA